MFAPMKTNHTPGPWKFNQIVGDVSTLAGKRICGVRFSSNAIPSKMDIANAKLIASAPQLLEALHQASFAIPTTHAAFDVVRQAIHAATE
jgi:hypothetical protein